MVTVDACVRGEVCGVEAHLVHCALSDVAERCNEYCVTGIHHVLCGVAWCAMIEMDVLMHVGVCMLCLYVGCGTHAAAVNLTLLHRQQHWRGWGKGTGPRTHAMHTAAIAAVGQFVCLHA